MHLGRLSKKWSVSQRKDIPLEPAKLCLSKWLILMFGVFWIPQSLTSALPTIHDSFLFQLHWDQQMLMGVLWWTSF